MEIAQHGADFREDKVFHKKNVTEEKRLGNLINILVGTTKLQAGLDEIVINTRQNLPQWIDKSWITALWNSLQEINRGLETEFSVQGKCRRYDKHILNIYIVWRLTKMNYSYSICVDCTYMLSPHRIW